MMDLINDRPNGKIGAIRFEPGIDLIQHASADGWMTSSPAEVACLLKSYTRDGQLEHRAASLDLRTGEVFDVDPAISVDDEGVVLRTLVPMIQSCVGEWRSSRLPEHLQEIACLPNDKSQSAYSISPNYCTGLLDAAGKLADHGARLMTATGGDGLKKTFNVDLSHIAPSLKSVRATGRSPMDAQRIAEERAKGGDALKAAVAGAEMLGSLQRARDNRPRPMSRGFVPA